MTALDQAVRAGAQIPLLPPAAASQQMSMTVGALAQMRYLGTGPRFVKLGPKTVRYRQSDLDEWIESNLRVSTGGAA